MAEITVYLRTLNLGESSGHNDFFPFHKTQQLLWTSGFPLGIFVEVEKAVDRNCGVVLLISLDAALLAELIVLALLMIWLSLMMIWIQNQTCLIQTAACRTRKTTLWGRAMA